MICSKNEIEQQLADAQHRTYRVREMVNSASTLNLNMSSADLFQMAEEEAFEDRNGECSICFECPFDDPLVTPCRHTFCRECIIEALQHSAVCPMCRAPTQIRNLMKPKVTESEPDGDSESKSGWKLDAKSDSKSNDKEEADDNVPDVDDDGNIRFDSKLKRLIAELRALRRDKPEDKVLIFTSFSRSLKWMTSELERNGFEYRTLSGNMSMNKRKKQLESFASDRDVKVFVLTVRSGAVGITLTAANHVFLMEPPFNPALYRQAINRVYRLGQNKKVFIRTMIMNQSIEQRIWIINRLKMGNHDDDGNGSTSNRSGAQMAGNIDGDRSANLDHNEISKLFEDEGTEQNEDGNSGQSDNAPSSSSSSSE